MLAPVYARLPLAALRALVERGVAVDPAGLEGPWLWAAQGEKATPGRRNLVRALLGLDGFEDDHRGGARALSAHFADNLSLFADVSLADALTAVPDMLARLGIEAVRNIYLEDVDVWNWARALRDARNAAVYVRLAALPDYAQQIVDALRHWTARPADCKARDIEFYDKVGYVYVWRNANGFVVAVRGWPEMAIALRALPDVDVREA